MDIYEPSNKTDMEQLLPHTKIRILKSILCSIFAQKNNICPLHNFGHTDYIHITCVFLAICCKKHIASVHKKAKRSVAYYSQPQNVVMLLGLKKTGWHRTFIHLEWTENRWQLNKSQVDQKVKCFGRSGSQDENKKVVYFWNKKTK